jgi:Zn-dependent M28 family amino/carboxypeptidase
MRGVFRTDPRAAPNALLLCVLTLPLLGCANGNAAAPETVFDAQRAWRDMQTQVGFGPRPAGSEALERTRAWLEAELRGAGLEPRREAFTADTPAGPIEMVNVFADLPAGAAADGAEPEILLLCAHYDTKAGLEGFVGANDGASGTAVVLELARVLAAGPPRPLSYRFLFVDGEEALRWEWRDPDNRYGSRHQAAGLRSSDLARRVRACVVIDMVADRDLVLTRDTVSDPRLAAVFLASARAAGLEEHMLGRREQVSDDHLSFMAVDIPSIDLIDLEYGPGNRFWHTLEDTLEHCSADSLAAIGRIVLGALPDLERDFRRR